MVDYDQGGLDDQKSTIPRRLRESEIATKCLKDTKMPRLFDRSAKNFISRYG